MGPQIQWLQSYVTGDKIYCVYIAPNEEMVREHAREGGFPANRVSAIKSIIDLTPAEQKSAVSSQQSAISHGLMGLQPKLVLENI